MWVEAALGGRIVRAEEGIPVPRVYGFYPSPRGIVLERAPGRANLATAASEAERRAVLDHYMELLARMHALDTAAFEAIGLRRPESAEQRGLLDFAVWERAYRARKPRAEPAIEYLIRWVRREVPQGRTRVSFVCADAGQFLFDAGRVTAVLDLDLELATLGDRARGIATYESATGEPVDRDAVDFHTVRFNAVTPMALAHLVVEPLLGLDFVQMRAWSVVWTRKASLGPAFDVDSLDETNRLLGRAHGKLAEADVALEAVIAQAGPDRDASLVALLHRRMLREETLLAPVLRELAGRRLQPIR